jgi:hypothetical protein
MWCILGDQGRELLQEIHAGTCGHHAGPRTLVGKAFRQGFYWPTAVTDSKNIVRRCEGCVVWTSLVPLPRWVPGPTTRWAPGTSRLVPHGT